MRVAEVSITLRRNIFQNVLGGARIEQAGEIGARKGV
jgi:hypothetical protein